jgi:hypothetical protein
MTGENRNTHHSTLRERIVEHLFVGEVLKTLWTYGVTDVEILRPEFDAHGYDLVMGSRGYLRHVQLKTQAGGVLSLGRALAETPSGCVVWIEINRETLQMGPFYWLGGKPGQRLPNIAQYEHPRRATHNKQGERPLRKNHHAVPRDAFTRLGTVTEVVEHLFGPLPARPEAALAEAGRLAKTGSAS